MRIRTVRLEFLRHGPSNNQLLSRITPYLALCGDHGAETITVPLDHRDFLLEQRVLRYQDGLAVRAAHLRRVGELLADVLGQVPGLVAAIGRPGLEPELVHLELVLSPAELALLPFEASLAPRGLLASGSELLTHPEQRIALSRNTRRARHHHAWYTRPAKILIACASPPGVPKVPSLAHVAAIRAAFAPWVRPPAEGQTGDNATEAITVLENATLPALRAACAQGRFTHVHLLAHGKGIPEVGGERFGLVLHPDRADETEQVVDGSLLLNALRTLGSDGELTCPEVVSIAACDAGNVGSVIMQGASLAHVLHDGGIPLVVASQFPLSFEGSVVLAESLYTGLLRGADPRQVLHDVRRALHGLSDRTHDWASLVAYADFPEGLEAQVERNRRDRATDAAGAVLKRTDAEVVARRSPPEGWEADLDRCVRWLADELPEGDEPNQRWRQGEIYGRLASIEKRRAQLRQKLQATPEQVRGANVAALTYYRRGFGRCPWSHWLAVQCLFLEARLDQPDSQALLAPTRELANLALAHAEPAEQAWARGTLTELELLQIFLRRGDEAARQLALRAAQAHLAGMIELMGLHSFHVLSTRRQLRRYQLWWGESFPDFSKLAATLADGLPGAEDDDLGASYPE